MSTPTGLTTEPTRLIGFEKDEDVRALLEKFALFPGYPETLPAHLLEIMRQQHPRTIIDAIELLEVSKCEFGGMQQKGNEGLVAVQTLDVPLDLKVAVRVDAIRLELDVKLIIKGEGLDSAPTVRSDMLVTGQRSIE